RLQIQCDDDALSSLVSYSTLLGGRILSQGTVCFRVPLKNLVHKGVKVELGLPYEQHEEVVEDWYLHHLEERLNTSCSSTLSPLSLSECLREVWKGDMGTKGLNEEIASKGEGGGKTDDAGEL
uniref:Uncharacterized protein n=1 Tax=Oncorhynchus mykiss TaxID=8022 RepID=A0A8C7PBE1_ONCMY